MSIDLGHLPAASNRGRYQIIRQIVDDDTGDPIDLSQATIILEVFAPNSTIALLSARTGDSHVTTPDTGVFQIEFTRTEMSALDPGEYDVGCTIKQSASEDTQQLFVATLPVINGNVSL